MREREYFLTIACSRKKDRPQEIPSKNRSVITIAEKHVRIVAKQSSFSRFWSHGNRFIEGRAGGIWRVGCIKAMDKGGGGGGGVSVWDGEADGGWVLGNRCWLKHDLGFEA